MGNEKITTWYIGLLDHAFGSLEIETYTWIVFVLNEQSGMNRKEPTGSRITWAQVAWFIQLIDLAVLPKMLFYEWITLESVTKCYATLRFCF